MELFEGFCSQARTSKKEGKETIFWLSLIGDTNSSYIKTKVKPFLTEGNEIVAIVSSIINKTRDRK